MSRSVKWSSWFD